MTTAMPEALPIEQVDAIARHEPMWHCIVWNDPVNLMSYVEYVFRSYFALPKAKAHALMMQVHEEGRSAVSSGTREKIEVDVAAMHSFGLWATLSQDGAE